MPDTWPPMKHLMITCWIPDKNIYKTSTAYTAATDHNNGAARYLVPADLLGYGYERI